MDENHEDLKMKIDVIKSGLFALLLLGWTLSPIIAAEQAPQAPPSSVINQIIHNQGNIGLAVTNFGYLGDYYWAGIPSGRWPANSTHDYLAQMVFWIGGVNAAGDTLLANTMDDFYPILNVASGNNDYRIMVSNDTTTYNYDASDTTGAGIGFPAHGWRVWDITAQQWDYNQVYNSLSSSFQPGGAVSVQESICRYGDDASGTPVLGLEITQTIRQWNYKHIGDMIIITLEITNASTEDYHDVAFGLYCDFDIGGPDPNTGENGRLGDLVNHDTDLDLAWTFDEDGYDPGWGPGVRTGYMGTTFLSTPGDIGMTSFSTGQWELLPTTDRARYQMIDGTEFAQSLPPTDQYYVQAIRGMDLAAGESIRIDYALIAGSSEDKLKSVVNDARNLYANNFISSRPPDNASVQSTPRSNKIAISWDNTSELSVDPSNNSTDFRGYKIFRSTDMGKTWGNLIENVDGSKGPDYVPLAQYERDAFGRIPHTFIDSNLTNGMEYWYAVIPYDSTALEIDFNSGRPEIASYIVSAFPRAEPLGYQHPVETIEHAYSGNWKGDEDAVSLFVINDADITGDDYQITFNEDCLDITWNLINTTTGDTVLGDQTQTSGLPNSYPIADGLQIIVTVPTVDEHYLPETAEQLEFSTSGVETILPDFIEKFYPEDNCFEHFRNDIEIRFTDNGSFGYDFGALVWYDAIVQVPLPFEVWDITNEIQLDVWIVDWSEDGEWTIADFDWLILTNYQYDNGNLQLEAIPDYFTWLVELSDISAPATGDIYSISGVPIVSSDDEFLFSSEKIIAGQVSANLDKIHTVPNPYIGYAKWETGRGNRKMQFVNLPDICTIRVYTLSGELINTLEHTDGSGAHDWNMLSESGRSIAAGVYLYNVESQYGNFNGKFAVVK
ncbi:MAG: hypothetical protein ABIE07_04210 [Candidatus Zixiibacteriota bacterium]